MKTYFGQLMLRIINLTVKKITLDQSDETILFVFLTCKLTINVPVVYMVRYKVVLRGDYP